MSTIKANNIQIGQSATPTQNFTVTTNVDGTARIARGNAGSTTQDVLTVDAAGVVDLPVGVTSGSAPLGRMQLFASKATTSGTYVDFSPADGTGIPSWAKRVSLIFAGVSTNGSSTVQVQLGTSLGFEVTGYTSSVIFVNAGASNGAFTTGVATLTTGHVSYVRSGRISFNQLSGSLWVADGLLGFDESTGAIASIVARKTLSGTLDRIRVTTVNGADTFDAGSVSILVEGY